MLFGLVLAVFVNVVPLLCLADVLFQEPRHFLRLAFQGMLPVAELHPHLSLSLLEEVPHHLLNKFPADAGHHDHLLASPISELHPPSHLVYSCDLMAR